MPETNSTPRHAAPTLRRLVSLVDVFPVPPRLGARQRRLGADLRRWRAVVARGVRMRCRDCGAAPETVEMLRGVDEARSLRAVRTVRLADGVEPVGALRRPPLRFMFRERGNSPWSGPFFPTRVGVFRLTPRGFGATRRNPSACSRSRDDLV
jgi:hypothetical protein